VPNESCLSSGEGARRHPQTGCPVGFGHQLLSARCCISGPWDGHIFGEMGRAEFRSRSGPTTASVSVPVGLLRNAGRVSAAQRPSGNWKGLYRLH